MRKADLQPTDGKSPNCVTLDETVIQLNDERYWLLAVVDPATNEFPHVRLHPACTIALIEQFLCELRAKHDVADALFLVDSAPWLQTALYRYDFRFHHVTHGKRNAVERVFKEIKQRANQFTTIFATRPQNLPNRGFRRSRLLGTS